MCQRRASWVVLLVVVMLLAVAMPVLGIDRERVGEAGSWRDPQMWDPPQPPQAGDNCFQRERATGVMFYDDFTEDEQAASLTVLGGGDPPRGFEITDGSYFVIRSFTKTGAGGYEVLVGDRATFWISSGPGGISRGNWTLVGDDPQTFNVVNQGLNGIDFQDGTWILGPGCSIWNVEGGIQGDPDNSRLTTLAHNVIVNEGEGIELAYVSLCPGCVLVGATVFQLWREALVDGGILSVDNAFVGHDVEDFGSVLTIQNGGNVTVRSTVQSVAAFKRHSTLRYAGTGNVLSTMSLRFDALDAVMQRVPEMPTTNIDVGFDLDFAVRTDADHFAAWNASGVAIFAGRTGVPTTTMEVTYGDFGGLFFVDVGCVPYSSFKVRATSGSTVTLVDNFDNAFHGAGAPPEFLEALYVDGDVTVGAGSRLDLNGINLYYTGTLTLEPNAQIVGGEPVQVRALNYGDFDADCDVDLDDYLTFQLHYTGSEGETDWPPADGDCDKDVDQADYLKFQLNFTGSLPGCDSGEGGNAPSGGGGDERFTGSLEELAGWSWYYLSARQRQRLADRLETVVRSGQGGDQTDQIAALARMLR